MKREVSLLARSTLVESRVLVEDTANHLKAMLQAVVNEGTGTKAAIPAYKVAGKTGTVRKLGKEGYEDTQHLAFFAGMTPVKRPRLVGVVLINEPQTDQDGGGSVAAPLFSRVMSGALRLLNVPPDAMDEAA